MLDQYPCSAKFRESDPRVMPYSHGCSDCYASYAGYASLKATGGLIRRKCRKDDRNQPWMRRRSHGEHSVVGGSSREEQISLINLRNEAAATEATGVLICVASLLRCDRSGLA
jgi:hypothetical protein